MTPLWDFLHRSFTFRLGQKQAILACDTGGPIVRMEGTNRSMECLFSLSCGPHIGSAI